jgi:Ran GTPase-activating protein (RanGAP) involved in mRNA processing and transport
MRVNPELEHVLGQDIAIATREIISNGQCTYLNFFGYKMSPENILHIVSSLPYNTSLKIFELGKCSINDLGVQFFATTLSMYVSLECLDLYENCITDIGVQYLANMLRLNRTLSRLKLAYNNITNDGFRMLTNAIVDYNSEINYLSLKGNKLINDLCIYSIFNIIRYNKSLRTLNLEDCNISWYAQKSIQLCQTVYFRTDLEILL